MSVPVLKGYLTGISYETEKELDEVVKWINDFLEEVKMDVVFDQEKFVWFGSRFKPETFRLHDMNEIKVKISLYKNEKGYTISSNQFKGCGFKYIDFLRMYKHYFSGGSIPVEYKEKFSEIQY
jgi:hypothetical protein